MRDRDIDIERLCCVDAVNKIERLQLEAKHYQRWSEDKIAELRAEVECLRDGHEAIVQWAEAYPLDAFPEPDLKRAAELLEAGDITLSAVRVSAMRRVITGVAEISRRALDGEKE